MPHDPRRPYGRPWVTPDALPARPRPNVPNPFLPFEPSTIGAARPRVPQVPERKLNAAQRAYRATGEIGAAILKGLPELPLAIARDVSRAKNPDDMIRALTGVRLGANAPRTGVERAEQAVAIGSILIPALRAGRIAPAEIASLRNAFNYKQRAFPALREFEQRAPALLERARPLPGSRLGPGTAERESMSAIDRALAPSPLVSRVPPGTMLGSGSTRIANADIARVAELYQTQSGIKGTRLPGVSDVDKGAAQRMARAYEKLESTPNDPAVRSAYARLSDEVDRQYRAIEDAGYKIEFVDKDPYKSSAEMMDDLRTNRRLKVFRSNEDHPIFTRDQNDRFRAVHDFFGHALEGNQFGPKGEERAFRAHSAMFSSEAARAMATETRWQNSWVNFGPHSDLPVSQRPFAQQKAALMPEEFMGDYDAMPRERIVGASVKGADGKMYTGVNHGDARENAAEALRATPEGRAAMERNGGNAMIRNSEGFATDDGRHVSREEARVIANPPTLAPQYSQLHSSDLLPKESQLPGGNRGVPAVAPSPIQRLSDALLEDEARLLTSRTNPAFEAAGATLPDPEVFGAGAIAGAPKIGWYENSARALTETFGPEAPRFAALLSSLSPQRPVSENLRAALAVWEEWGKAGRPTDPKKIERLLHNVARATPEGGELPARIPNAIRSLTAEDPTSLVLSGSKVSAFHRNLIGDTQRVTLDTWMAKLGNVKPASLHRTVRGIGQQSPTSLAYTGRVRQTADFLKHNTGHAWTPAEVQETLWSWGKALTETAEPLARGTHPSQLSMLGPIDFPSAIPLVTKEKIRGAPDFATLMNEAPFTEMIQRQGLPLPIPRSTIPPRLPEPDPMGLRALAENLQRSVRNERGMAGAPWQQAPGRLVFHGTNKPGFDVPTRSSDIGPHVGTSGQATEIVRGAPYSPPSEFPTDWFPAGSRIIPLRDYSRNPARMLRDAGWGEPAEMARELAKTGALTPEEAEQFARYSLSAQQDEIAKQNARGIITNIPPFSQGYDELRALLRDKRYDSILYPNEVEADRWVRKPGGFLKVTRPSRVILDPTAHLRNLYDEPIQRSLFDLPEGRAALPMLGLSGGAALGGLTLWEYLNRR